MYEDMIILKGYYFVFKNENNFFWFCRYEIVLVINW